MPKHKHSLKCLKYFSQRKKWTCGPASMRMALSAIGISRRECDLEKSMHTTRHSGTLAKEFPQLAEQYKLDYAVQRNSSLECASRLMESGHCAIICYVDKGDSYGHYAVVRDIGKTRVCLLDPWYGPKREYPKKEFDRMWAKTTKVKRESRWLFALKKP